MAALRLLFLALVFCPVRAAIEPAGLVLNLRQEQVQQSQLNARTSDGRRDQSTKRVRVLHLDCRYLGDGADEPATLRWFFIGRHPVDGKFDYYSMGSEDVTIPRQRTLAVRLVSDPLRAAPGSEPELLPSVPVSARFVPTGWIVLVCQDGFVVKQAASTPGMLEWMRRNPPPTPKK